MCSAEVKVMMKCSACLFSLSFCCYFENEFLELAYVGRKLECLWRRPLTALMD